MPPCTFAARLCDLLVDPDHLTGGSSTANLPASGFHCVASIARSHGAVGALSSVHPVALHVPSSRDSMHDPGTYGGASLGCHGRAVACDTHSRPPAPRQPSARTRTGWNSAWRPHPRATKKPWSWRSPALCRRVMLSAWLLVAGVAAWQLPAPPEPISIFQSVREG